MHVSRPPDLNLRAALKIAHQLADKSGDVALRYFRNAPTIQNKDGDQGFDPVTAADQAAERAMTNLLARAYPDHGIVGEEYGVIGADTRYRWLLDPIDGTRAFIMGQPMWGTLIGLVDGDQPLLGVMNQPFTAERFWAGDKASYYSRNHARAKRIQTRTCRRLDSAILTSTDPALFSKSADRKAFQRLAGAVKMTRFGGDCYNYCLLAAGHIDLIVEVDLKPHDIVALIPIIERAGGKISTWEGLPATQGGRIIAAGDSRLHAEALKVLAGK